MSMGRNRRSQSLRNVVLNELTVRLLEPWHICMIAYQRYDPQLKTKSFASNSYRDVFPNKQILHDYAENYAILCPSANYESCLWV